MKPLNQKVRSSAITRFIIANIIALGMMGYSIYSYVFVNEKISTEVQVDTNEVKTLENFMASADDFISNYQDATNDTDRSKYSLELNKLILESRESFQTNAIVFDKLSERYKGHLRAEESISKMESNLGRACEEKIKDLEEEISDLKKENDNIQDDLKDAQKEGNQENKNTQSVKSSLKRIAGDMMTVATDINAMDWCPGIASGGGRGEIKSELKQRISALRNDLLSQAGQLQ